MTRWPSGPPSMEQALRLFPKDGATGVKLPGRTRPAASERGPWNPMFDSSSGRRAESESQPGVPGVRPGRLDVRPAEPGARPVGPEIQPGGPEARPVDPTLPLVGPQVGPVSPDVRPVGPKVGPALSEARPVSPEVGPVTPGARPADSGVRPVDPGARPVGSEAQPVLARNEPVASATAPSRRSNGLGRVGVGWWDPNPRPSPSPDDLASHPRHPPAGLNNVAEPLRWYDYWRKGIDNGIMREPIRSERP